MWVPFARSSGKIQMYAIMRVSLLAETLSSRDPKKLKKKKLELKKFCYTEDSKTVDTKIQDII